MQYYAGLKSWKIDWVCWCLLFSYVLVLLGCEMVWVSRATAQLPGYVGTVASKPLVSSGCQTSSRQDLFGEIVYGREQRAVISHHYSSHWIGTFMHQYNSISSMFSMILGRCKFAIWDNSVNSIVWGIQGHFNWTKVKSRETCTAIFLQLLCLPGRKSLSANAVQTLGGIHIILILHDCLQMLYYAV